MTRHQGEISVANKPGVGAAFTVKLPLTQAQSFKEETR
jgi:signal transduction histidine kinase